LLKAFRGIATITALSLTCEIGDIRRFEHPRQLMAYLGLVPSEHSSGNATVRGSITKAGNCQPAKPSSLPPGTTPPGPHVDTAPGSVSVRSLRTW